MNSAAIPVATLTPSRTIKRDATPPQVWVNVPAGVVTGPITVTWGATDAQAGVAYYDLDVSVDGGPWQRVLTRTTATTYVHTCTLANFHTFRLTATDHVSNGASVVARTSRVRVTKHYAHGGTRVALRAGGVVQYLHSDHLGSVSLITNHASRITAQQRFLPYGGVRYTEGAFPTDVGFTGHRGQAALGLIFMRARYYHPALGRFVSADTIVPEPSIPIDLNRYAYVRNSPLGYVDPSGHFSREEIQKSLQDQYGERWEEIWNLWAMDEYWMWVLETAQPEWLIWASDLGIYGRFEWADNRIVISVVGENGQAQIYQLWQFQGQGGYLLYNPRTGGRPFDPFITKGATGQFGYDEPVFLYSAEGVPILPYPVGTKNVYASWSLFGLTDKDILWRGTGGNPIEYNKYTPPPWGTGIFYNLPGEIGAALGIILPEGLSVAFELVTAEWLFPMRVYSTKGLQSPYVAQGRASNPGCSKLADLCWTAR